MSYILEALTKSEQARQQITATPKFSLMPVAGGEVAQQRIWPYALAGALVLNAAVLYVWVGPALPGGVPAIKIAKLTRAAEVAVGQELGIAPLARVDNSAQVVSNKAVQLTRAAEVPVGQEPGVAPLARVDNSAQAVSKKTVQLTRVAEVPVGQELGVAPLARFNDPAPAGNNPAPAVASALPAEATPLPPRPERVTPARIPVLAKALSAKPSKGSPNETRETRAHPVTAPKVIAKASAESAAAPVLAETSTPRKETASTVEPTTLLPQDMPSVSVAGFIRDEGAGGMVIVNDKLVREGDEVAPGLKLEKILQDGLVFNYKGQRFKR